LAGLKRDDPVVAVTAEETAIHAGKDLSSFWDVKPRETL
jgi:hypothetical protein